LLISSLNTHHVSQIKIVITLKLELGWHRFFAVEHLEIKHILRKMFVITFLCIKISLLCFELLTPVRFLLKLKFLD